MLPTHIIAGIPMVTIPAGVFKRTPIDSFCLGQTPITNEQYATHVDRYLSRPFVLLHTDSDTQKTSVLSHNKSPEEAIRSLAKHLPKDWDIRDLLMFGTLTLFELKKDMSPKGFDRSQQPVVNVSWFHAFEYCMSNGLFLPTDNQWEYAARGPKRHEYGTRSGKLTKKEAHYASEATADVGSYPPNGFGLRDMTGNIWEWTARNLSEELRYSLRGGSWNVVHPKLLRVSYRDDFNPDFRHDNIGFRVAASVPQDS